MGEIMIDSNPFQMMEVMSDESLIKHYYAHELGLLCSSTYSDSSKEKGVGQGYRLLSLLANTSLDSILSRLQRGFVPFEIASKNIPQFSKLDECFKKVPFLLVNCGIAGVTFKNLGYMLRQDRRSSVADQKYGENHGKLAAELGFCCLDGKKHLFPTILGYCFSKLDEEVQEKLIAPIVLYIPLIQNCFLSGNIEEQLEVSLSILSPSTQKRRLPNVRKLIEIINTNRNGL